jgi:hypothetical protein
LKSYVLSDADVELAEHLAEQTLARFAQRSGYYNNTSNSHLIGKYGEIAAARWLESEGLNVDAPFMDEARTREADLVWNGFRLDVKTWTARFWPQWGRCVAVNQVGALAAKADGILWLTVEATAGRSPSVRVEGWSTMDDIRAAEVRWTGPANGRKVQNHQLDPEALRPAADLIEVLRQR